MRIGKVCIKPHFVKNAICFEGIPKLLLSTLKILSLQ